MYKSTERISLVSSFAASLFAGEVSNTDIRTTNVLSVNLGGGNRLVGWWWDEPSGHPDQGMELRPTGRCRGGTLREAGLSSQSKHCRRTRLRVHARTVSLETSFFL